MLQSFLTYLHRGGAYGYYHALPDRRSYWFRAGDAPGIPDTSRASNWYFGVHPVNQIPPCNAHGEIKAPRYVRAQKRYICAINCLYAEFDAKQYGSKDLILAHMGVLGTGSAMRLANLVFVSGAFKACTKAWFKRWITVAGVPAGATKPHHVSTAKSFRLSAIAGTSGNAALRVGVVTASAKSLPVLMLGAAVARLSKLKST